MRKDEFMSIYENADINAGIVAQLETEYKSSIPEEVAKLISLNLDKLSDNSRVMDIAEICRSSELYGVDFIGKKIIPCIDCFDNDFIVYDLKTMKWMSFNIVDEIAFGDSYPDLENVLSSLLE